MIRLTTTPKTFVYGFDRQEIEVLQFNDLFSDNLYELEKVFQGQYPDIWLQDCIKLVVNGFETSVTEVLCYILRGRNQTNIKYMNIVMWPNKMFFNWQGIESKVLKLDQEILEKYQFESQDHFIYCVNLKTETYVY